MNRNLLYTDATSFNRIAGDEDIEAVIDIGVIINREGMRLLIPWNKVTYLEVSDTDSILSKYIAPAQSTTINSDPLNLPIKRGRPKKS